MKKKAFAVLGLGKYGMGVADELMERGAEVLVADKNERLIEQNAGKYTQAVCMTPCHCTRCTLPKPA